MMLRAGTTHTARRALCRGLSTAAPGGRRSILAATAQAVPLPDLPYDYGALEPYINGEIMKLHHSKHHQTYVNNFNGLLEKQADAEAKGDYATLTSLQGAIKFNGGGACRRDRSFARLPNVRIPSLTPRTHLRTRARARAFHRIPRAARRPREPLDLLDEHVPQVRVRAPEW